MIDPELDPPFLFLEPSDIRAPVLVNSPHSGHNLPRSFLAKTRLSAHELLRSADLYMDEMIAPALQFGVPIAQVHFPRAFLDVNREPYELDPRMFDRKPPSFANTRSLRVTSGYGTVPRLVAEGVDIYRGRLPLEDALDRIDRYYLPYHAALRQALDRLHQRFGMAMLIDCHSMPSASLIGPARFNDIVLGDRHGTSCAPELIDLAESVLRMTGLTVARNHPYSGGFITEQYGNPVAGIHALQIEVNRALYMDEATYRPHTGFEATRQALMTLVEALTDLQLPSVPPSLRLAAE